MNKIEKKQKEPLSSKPNEIKKVKNIKKKLKKISLYWNSICECHI